MTPEKAIKGLKPIVDNEAFTDRFQDVCKTAVAALEKQIPKKPVFEPGSDEILQCQGCGADLAWTSSLKPKYRADYCERCGQAVDWSDWENQKE